MNRVSGGCLCGTFHYTVTGSFGDVRYCHCSQCRRGNGTAFSANARISKSQWKLDGPRESITEFEHSPGVYRAFCKECGSPLYARLDREPESIRIRLGGFEGEVDARITGHVWVESKSSWYQIKDELPLYEGAFTP